VAVGIWMKDCSHLPIEVFPFKYLAGNKTCSLVDLKNMNAVLKALVCIMLYRDSSFNVCR